MVGYGGDRGQALAGYTAYGKLQGDPNTPGVTPYGSQASPGASGAQASGGINAGAQNAANTFYGMAGQAISAVPQVASPSLTYQGLTPASLNYPQYMRAQGENMAQQGFQNQVNQGIRQGNAGNAYTQAMNARNNARLGYMGQAGQAQLGVDTAGAGLLNAYQQQLLNRYGYDINQRNANLGIYGQAMGAAASSMSADAAASNAAMARQSYANQQNAQYGTTAENNKDQGDAGVFKGMGGTSIGYSPSNYTNLGINSAGGVSSTLYGPYR